MDQTANLMSIGGWIYVNPDISKQSFFLVLLEFGR